MKTPFPFPDVVLKDIRAGHAREVLRQMADALEIAEGADAAVLMNMLMNAENSGGSAIGDGVAVVSARVPRGLAGKRLCAFAQLAKPVAFRGVEDHPCDLVFIMASPDDEAQAHLRDLSVIIRTLRDRDFLDRLRSAGTTDRMAGLFRARDLAQAQAAA
jgi:mannitol/fructose-specific phosphotransferase system IIA component (Ntr-type)